MLRVRFGFSYHEKFASRESTLAEMLTTYVCTTQVSSGDRVIPPNQALRLSGAGSTIWASQDAGGRR
jgi:hypothetical protein